MEWFRVCALLHQIQGFKWDLPHRSRLVVIDVNVVVAVVAFVTVVVVDGAFPQDPRQVFPGTVDGINFAS